MKKLKKIILCCLVLVFTGMIATAQARYVVSDSSPMLFNDKNVRVYADTSNQASYREVLNKSDQFVPSDQIKSYKGSVTYWIIQDIASELDHDREIQIDASGWRDLTAHVINDKGEGQAVEIDRLCRQLQPLSCRKPDCNSHYPI